MAGAVHVSDIAGVMGGAVTITGPSDRTVHVVAPIDEATPEALVFCSREGVRARHLIAETAARVVICAHDLELAPDVIGDRTLIRVSNPRLAFAQAVNAFFLPLPPPADVHPTAIVDPAAVLGDRVSVGPYAIIEEGCTIGDDTIVGPHVVIRAGTQVGARVVLDPGVVLGTDGFGFERDTQGRPVKLASLGGVRIGDDVEIGAYSCIDRGTMADTVVGDRTKIDNLVHVAHNATVATDVIIPASATLGGSTRIGNRSWVGVGSTVLESKRVGEDALVGAGAVVTKDVKAGTVVFGNPARLLRPQR